MFIHPGERPTMRDLLRVFSLASDWTSSETSFASRCPLASLRPNASIKLSYRSRPFAWAAACAPSGKGGVAVSQARI